MLSASGEREPTPDDGPPLGDDLPDSVTPDSISAGLPSHPARIGLSARTAAVIFLGALLLRAVVLADLSHNDPWFANPVVDERTNVEDARKIVRVGIPNEKPYWKPPLYPHLLSIGIALGIGSEQPNPGPEPRFSWVVKVGQALLDSWTAVLIAAIALRLAGRRPAIFAGAVHALGFLPVYYCAQILDTTLYVFLTIGTLRLALAATEESMSSTWLAIGAAAGLAAITRATMLVSIPVFALAPWLGSGSTKRRVRDGALVLAAAVIVVLPVTLANLRFGKDRVLISSNGGVNFYIGNRRGGGVGADGLTSVPAGPRWTALLLEARHLDRPSERSAHYYGQGLEELSHLRHAVGRIATKLHALVHSTDIPNNKSFVEERRRSWSLRFLPGRSGVVIPLILTGLIFSGVLLRRRALLLGVIATQAAIPLAFFVAARYRVPLLALGAIPAGAVLASIFDRTAPTRRRALLAGGTLFLAALLGWDPHGWRERFDDYVIDPVALGFALEQNGDIEGARGWYQRALLLDPVHPPAEVQLGSLALIAKDLPEAERHFRRAVEADPDFSLAWNSLGALLLGTGRPDEAFPSFERAIAADPHYAPPRAMLGQMLESAGQYPKARMNYEAARRIEPRRSLYGLLEARVLWRMYRPGPARTLLAEVDRSKPFPPDEQEVKLRRELVEDLEIWPDGPPTMTPPESGEGGDEQPGG